MKQMAEPNYYDHLGITTFASTRTINKAYRTLAKHLHPDKTGSRNTHLFRKVQVAYETLSNTVLRTLYDKTQDSTICTEVTIRFIDTMSDFSTYVHVTRRSTRFPDGTWNNEHEVVPLLIIAGTTDGTLIRVASCGHMHCGDLIVRVKVLPNMQFETRADGLFWTRRSITLWEALTGFRFYFRHLSGDRVLVTSDMDRIYQTGDVIIVPPPKGTTTISSSVHIDLQVRFPTTKISSSLRKQILLEEV